MSTTYVQSASYGIRKWIKEQRSKGQEPTVAGIWARIEKLKYSDQREEVFQHVMRLK